MSSRPLFLGFTDDREHPTDEPERRPSVRVHLTEDERATGVHVIGAPGTGKSKFLEHCIRDDIRHGRGLCLIDPHGELYDNVLAWCTWVHPYREIIPLNVSEGTHVLGFNPFQGGAGDVHTHVNRCIEATVKAWGVRDTDETPTLERILRCIYHALTENNLTMAEAEHLLSFDDDAGVRDYLTSRITHPVIRKEWRELSSLKTLREHRDEFRSTKNKLLRFLTARSVLRFLALTEPTRTLDLQKIMDRGVVLLVNLRLKRGTLDAMDARLFGSLLVSQLFDVARNRGGLGQPLPRPFYLYCDEFQNFVNPDVAEILPQGRKFGLSLILAHQFLAQLDAEDARLVEAVMAAARTKIVFGGLSPQDAAAMVPALFAGQIDYHETKRIEYNTEFWPRYGREHTRAVSHATGRSQTETTSRSHTDGSGYASGGSSGTAHSVGTGYSLPDAAGTYATHTHSNGLTHTDTTSYIDTGMSADTDSESTSVGTSETDAETVGDIPFYFLDRHDVPEKEYWSLEEQKERLAHVLMLQLQRHCFVKPRDGRAVAVLVPVVKPYPLPPQLVLEYETEQTTRAGALTPEQVDDITTERTKQLEHQARAFFDQKQRDDVHSQEYVEPESLKRKPATKPRRQT